MDTIPGKPRRRVVRLKRAMEITGDSRSGIYAGMKAGTYPKCIPLGDGSRSVGWIEDELFALNERRIAAARGDEPSELKTPGSGEQ